MAGALSYSSGQSATGLLGDTIGGNFDATVRAFGDREALVDRSEERRWTYAELAADGKSYTEVNWLVSKESEKTSSVYDKQ